LFAYSVHNFTDNFADTGQHSLVLEYSLINKIVAAFLVFYSVMCNLKYLYLDSTVQ